MRSLIPASLTGRLIAIAIALVTVTCLLIAVAATLIMRTYLNHRLDQELAASLDRATRSVSPDFDGQLDGPRGAPPTTPRGNREDSLFAVVTDSGAQGVVLTHHGEEALDADGLALLGEVAADRKPLTVSLPDLGTYRVAATTADNGVIVIQGVPTDDVDETVRTLMLWELALGLGGAAVAAVAGRALVQRQLIPLREVARTAERVTQHDLTSGEVGQTERVRTELANPCNEVGQVGNALNQLLGHVEDALDARHASEQQARQFLADASHELRTPLSTIRGYAELSRRMGASGELETVLSKVDSESQRMTRLVEDMLLLARLDAGRDIEPRPVELSQLVTESIRDAAVVDPDRKFKLELPDEPIVVTGDEQRLHQLVTNLLRNASRHTPEGTKVSTSLAIEGDQIVLVVTDNGPGIDPELLPTIFDRFSRGDTSRTRASGGAGLGTALVQAIAHAHGGEASVVSEPGDTRFTVRLPNS